MNCNDKYLVCLLSCKFCGLQYVDSTTDSFRYSIRWNIWTFEHFASNGHNGFLEVCTITLIDKTDGADPTGREEYWRRVLKTALAYGLNTVAWRSHIFARLLYIFPRQGCYYCKMFNLVITIICTEKPSGEGSYHMETSQFICFPKGLAGFLMVLVFTERYFCAEYVLFVLGVKLFSAMVIVVSSKSLVCCYYEVCN